MSASQAQRVKQRCTTGQEMVQFPKMKGPGDQQHSKMDLLNTLNRATVNCDDKSYLTSI